MLDHIGYTVADYAASKAFFARVLAPLDYGLVMEVTPEMTGVPDAYHAGFGARGKPVFWIGTGKPLGGGLHVAFSAATRGAVDAFHAAALAAGARDNGAPGLRPQYHPDYYGAFVIDRDGNNIEAVCHEPA